MSSSSKKKSKISFWIMFKSYLYSLKYHFWLKGNKFQKIKSLHDISDEQSSFIYNETQKQYIREVSTIIKKVEAKAPWNPKCYNLAMLARKLLQQKNIPSKLRIGFRIRNNQMDGHAWVVCNRTVVSGYKADLLSYNKLKPIKD